MEEQDCDGEGIEEASCSLLALIYHLQCQESILCALLVAPDLAAMSSE